MTHEQEFANVERPRHDHYRKLIDSCATRPPNKTAARREGRIK